MQPSSKDFVHVIQEPQIGELYISRGRFYDEYGDTIILPFDKMTTACLMMVGSTVITTVPVWALWWLEKKRTVYVPMKRTDGFIPFEEAADKEKFSQVW